MNRLNLEKIVSYLFDQIKRSIRRANKQKKKGRRGEEMKEYHFIFFFSSKKSRPKRVEKRLKEALLGIFGNFIAQDRSKFIYSPL